jgi:hypothetical protein
VNTFSVASKGQSTPDKRAIVVHTGSDEGAGVWECTKDWGNTSCSHINRARHHLQQLLKGDLEARHQHEADSGEQIGVYIYFIYKLL